MDFQKIKATLLVQGTNLGLKILGALALWIVGLILIKFLVRLTERALRFRAVDSTVVRYVSSTLSVLLKVVLVVAILGFFGVQTATFAALLAAAGLAIGAAWSGLLANFAAGAFLIVFRPFKVGDIISAGGVTGSVEEVGLFTTTIHSPDNVKNIVGNNKIFSDTIQNFSSTAFRRVDLEAPLHYSVDPAEAMNHVKGAIEKVPNVLSEPAPVVEILRLHQNGTLIAVRPFCKNQDYWQVYFDTNKTLRDVFEQAGYPPPDTKTIPMTLEGKV
jgi:small conductance mechanosensitive channel